MTNQSDDLGDVEAVRLDRNAPLAARDDATTLLKVLAYVIRERDGRRELLVFDRREKPGASVEVPAGTIDPGESPEAAARRELFEESGVTADPAARIDVYEWEHPENGRWHRRHVYEFAAPANLPEHWHHVVSAGEDEIGQTFACHWLAVEEAEKRLVFDQGRSLNRLNPRASVG
jgi:8-oxo-dGTP pyrophosphatase MutT (NUDIX family)